MDLPVSNLRSAVIRGAAILITDVLIPLQQQLAALEGSSTSASVAAAASVSASAGGTNLMTTASVREHVLHKSGILMVEIVQRLGIGEGKPTRTLAGEAQVHCQQRHATAGHQ